MRFCLIILVSLIPIIDLLGQTTNPKQKLITGRTAIPQLHEGTLIVRLSKFNEKIETISALEGEPNALIEAERIHQANINLLNEFKNDYSFSDIVFAFNVDLHNYLQNRDLNIFLDDELNIDPAIKIKEGPIYILASQGYTTYRLYDDQFNVIEKPSPQYINHHIVYNYKYFLTKTAQGFRELITRDRSVLKFNKKLFFYLRQNPLINLDR